MLNPDNATRNYRDTLKEANFKILNKINKTFCTRETIATKSLIDHVCSNLKDNNFHLAIVDSSFSDHKQIFLEVKRYKTERIKKVEYTTIDYNKFYKQYEEIAVNNKEHKYEKFEESLLSCLSKSKIIKSKIMNPPRQDWIKKEIIDEINHRNLLWQKCKTDSSDFNVKEYEKSKLKVTKIIQNAKNTYYYKRFIDNVSKPRKMWRLINDLSGNKIKLNNGPDSIETDNGVITNKSEICKYLNTYFSNVGSSLANLIPDKFKKNISKQVFGKKGNTELQCITPATNAEVVKIIDDLDANTGSGIDGISTKCIKSVKNLIVTELTECINKCLAEGIFPDSLKIAKVTPLYKSGNKSDCSNYRPISVLPVIAKIFEKILYKRLESFLKSGKILYHKQYGFRPKHSTLSATIDLVTKIKNKIDQKQIALGIFVDLRKAFDTISPDILIHKLSHIGITGNALKIFESYLQNRQQIVKINQYKSCSRVITCGVPQGSILGPLLFLIYINNISHLGLKGDISLYADDTSLFYFGHSIECIIPQVQNDLKILNEWFQMNLLTINVTKTNFVIFAAKNKKVTTNIQLEINNHVLERKSQEKYLGLILDKYLNWKSHIEKIKRKLLSLTGLLQNIKKSLPRKVRYIIYNSLVKPHIDYLIEVWGTAGKNNLEILQRAQNRLIKILFNYKFLTSSRKIYEDTKIMNIKQSYMYYTCILIRKILNNEINTSIKFTKKHELQTKKLRNTNHLVTRRARTNYGKKNIEFDGVNIYNKLPTYIKESKTMAKFKKLLKLHIIGTYT